MTDIDRKASEIHNKVQKAMDHDEYDPDHEKDLVVDVFIGEVPYDDLAEWAVDLEFEHPDGPMGTYQLEESVNHVLQEWFDDAVPSTVSDDVKEYLRRRHRDEVQEKAKTQFKNRKD